MKILLLGLMGSGKTTVGLAVADRVGWPYLDNDEVVEEVAGATKARLVETQGTEALRGAEARALREVIERPGPLVASVAAGVVLDPADVAPLRPPPPDVAVVWLRAAIGTLAERLRADPGDRPWLTGDLEDALRRMAAHREPGFAEIAQVVVDVDDLRPDETAAEIVDRLRLTADERPNA